MSQHVTDVLVVGGGPVGACVGALLARSPGRGPPLRVGLLHTAEPSVAAAAGPDARVLAVSRASERILEAAGAWAAIAPHAAAYEHMRIWYEGIAPLGEEGLRFDAAEAGEANLGYIIEGRRVTAALTDAFVAAGGELIAGEFTGIAAAAAPGAGVRVQSSAGECVADLVIGADGAGSPVRPPPPGLRHRGEDP